MTKQHFDSIVIGAGSAGLAFATAAAGHGARVALVERAELGGTCVNRGCVPQKILWATGQMQRRVAGAAARGITRDLEVDFAELVRSRDTKIAQIRDGYQEKLADAGITLVRGTAEVVSETCVRVGVDQMMAHQIVLATGTKPTALEIDGSEHLSDSADVLSR